ncbi:hypothetical protein HK102_007163, partial [Quaeritorhiza haematococci]
MGKRKRGPPKRTFNFKRIVDGVQRTVTITEPENPTNVIESPAQDTQPHAQLVQNISLPPNSSHPEASEHIRDSAEDVRPEEMIIVSVHFL